jgi:hypothetical protein
MRDIDSTRINSSSMDSSLNFASVHGHQLRAQSSSSAGSIRLGPQQLPQGPFAVCMCLAASLHQPTLHMSL